MTPKMPRRAMVAFRGISLLSRCLQTRHGNALIEFTLVAPIFILAMLGTIDFGRMMWINSTIEQAAKAGARYAAIRGSEKIIPVTGPDEVATFVKARATGIPDEDLLVDPNIWPDGCNDPGCRVRVAVDYQFEFLMIGFLPLDPVQLQGYSEMVIN